MALTDPPPDLHQRSLFLTRSPSQMVRISHRKYPDPVHWSRRGVNRFDDPAAPWGVCYAGEDFETAVIEVFGDRWIENPSAPRAVNLRDLAHYDVWDVEAATPLLIVNLTGEGLSRAGTDGNLCTSTDYAVARRWAIAFMRHPDMPQGLAYHSRHNPVKINYAVFGDSNTRSRLRAAEKTPLINHPELYRVLDRYDVAGV
jgi:hypothetical protein